MNETSAHVLPVRFENITHRGDEDLKQPWSDDPIVRPRQRPQPIVSHKHPSLISDDIAMSEMDSAALLVPLHLYCDANVHSPSAA